MGEGEERVKRWEGRGKEEEGGRGGGIKIKKN